MRHLIAPLPDIPLSLKQYLASPILINDNQFIRLNINELVYAITDFTCANSTDPPFVLIPKAKLHKLTLATPAFLIIQCDENKNPGTVTLPRSTVNFYDTFTPGPRIDTQVNGPRLKYALNCATLILNGKIITPEFDFSQATCHFNPLHLLRSFHDFCEIITYFIFQNPKFILEQFEILMKEINSTRNPFLEYTADLLNQLSPEILTEQSPFCDIDTSQIPIDININDITPTLYPDYDNA